MDQLAKADHAKLFWFGLKFPAFEDEALRRKKGEDCSVSGSNCLSLPAW
ncbi:MAG: hypothetical protein KDC34_19405 [Saprospiraceae bacterium]|nr:hypothetical protein [Saprospiraceae bacterium]